MSESDRLLEEIRQRLHDCGAYLADEYTKDGHSVMLGDVLVDIDTIPEYCRQEVFELNTKYEAAKIREKESGRSIGIGGEPIPIELLPLARLVLEFSKKHPKTEEGIKKGAEEFSRLYRGKHITPKLKIDDLGYISYLKQIPISMVELKESGPGYSDPRKVDKYAKMPTQTMPPILVFGPRFPGDTYLVYDGHHRLKAAKQKHLKSIMAWVTPSGKERLLKNFYKEVVEND